MGSQAVHNHFPNGQNLTGATPVFAAARYAEAVKVLWTSDRLHPRALAIDRIVDPCERIATSCARSTAIGRAGLSYFNPHSFRSTLVHLGQTVCQTPEQFKAWSQNLGHEKVLTTFLNYGEVECLRQGEIIRGLRVAHPVGTAEINNLAEAVIRKLRAAGSC